LYIDYGTAALLPPGTHQGLGMAYLGRAATENSFYKGLAKSTVATLRKGQGGTGDQLLKKQAYWGFRLVDIVYSDPLEGDIKTYIPTFPAGACDGGNCIIDTGNPRITIPTGSTYLTMIINDLVAKGAKAQEVVVSIRIAVDEAKYGLNKTISVDLPGQFILDLNKQGSFDNVAVGNTIYLGLPIFQFYYMVFDSDAYEITFARLPEGTN